MLGREIISYELMSSSCLSCLSNAQEPKYIQFTTSKAKEKLKNPHNRETVPGDRLVVLLEKVLKQLNNVQNSW